MPHHRTPRAPDELHGPTRQIHHLAVLVEQHQTIPLRRAPVVHEPPRSRRPPPSRSQPLPSAHRKHPDRYTALQPLLVDSTQPRHLPPLTTRRHEADIDIRRIRTGRIMPVHGGVQDHDPSERLIRKTEQ